jgi:hypothetical protein
MVRTVVVETYQPGIEPGMTINIASGDHGISGVGFLVTSVKMTHAATQPGGAQVFKYEIAGVEGNSFRTWSANWAQYFRSLGGSSGSAGAVGVSGGTVVSQSVVPAAFWGGSKSEGMFANATWMDVPSAVPVRIVGNGQPVSVRIFQATGNSGTSVQARIVQRVGVTDSQVASTATTTNVRNLSTAGSNFSEELVTFTPNLGAGDYVLQLKGGNGNAPVFAIAISV